MNLKPDDFKDVLPNFVQRAMFKNQYDKFVKMISIDVIDPSDVDDTIEMLDIPQTALDHVFDSGIKQIIDSGACSSNMQAVDAKSSSTISVETQGQNLLVRQIKTAQVFIKMLSMRCK